MTAHVGWLGVAPQVAKRGARHGRGFGRVRWVVERTISWVKGLRRMCIRYDRLQVIQQAWNALAAAAVCFQIAGLIALCRIRVLSELLSSSQFLNVILRG